MKQSHIEQLIMPSNFPYVALKNALEKTTEYPIFKIKERDVIDAASGRRDTYSTHFCGSCNSKFESKNGTNRDVQCGYCGNRVSGYQDCKIQVVSDDFTFDDDGEPIVCLEDDFNDDRTLRDNSHFMEFEAVLDNNPQERQKFTTFFVLEKQVLDNTEYFILRHFKYFYEFNTDTKQKHAILIYRKNLFIFGQNEIVNIRQGKKSVAKFASSLVDYGWHCAGDTQIIFSDVDTFNAFQNTVMGYSGVSSTHTPLGATNEKFFYHLSLAKLDRLNNALKNSTKKVHAPNKRDEVLQSILNNLPVPKPFTVDCKEIFLTELEHDKINGIKTYRFLCSNCNEVHTIKLSSSWFYTSKSENVFNCPNCKKEYCRDNVMDFFTNNNVERQAIVVDDFADGVIVYDAEYTQTVEDNRMIFTPINGSKPKNICVIENIENSFGILNSSIVRYDDKKHSYYMARVFNFSDTRYFRLKNFANNLKMQWSGVENMQQGTRFACSVDEIAAYILLYNKYPVMEQIVKEGLIAIADDIITAYQYDIGESKPCYSLSKDTVPDALHLSRYCINILKQCSTRCVTVHEVLFMQALYAQDRNITLEQYRYIEKHCLSAIAVADLCRKFGFTVHQICQYLERVRVAQCISVSSALSCWSDYLQAAHLIGSDISDKKVRYPSALKTEHDKVVYKKKIIEDAAYAQKFNEITKSYGEKLSFSGKRFIITYPKTLNDLFEEGRKLNHCAGTYGDKISEEDSIILFVRKKEAPDEPYYTIEINPQYNALVQLHGYDNHSPNYKKEKDLLEFIKGWADKKHIAF